jgi:hypothetical protein
MKTPKHISNSGGNILEVTKIELAESWFNLPLNLTFVYVCKKSWPLI